MRAQYHELDPFVRGRGAYHRNGNVSPGTSFSWGLFFACLIPSFADSLAFLSLLSFSRLFI